MKMIAEDVIEIDATDIEHLIKNFIRDSFAEYKDRKISAAPGPGAGAGEYHIVIEKAPGE